METSKKKTFNSCVTQLASISVTRVTKGSKLRIATTRWGRRSKIALKTPLKFQGESFGAIKIFENEIFNIR